MVGRNFENYKFSASFVLRDTGQKVRQLRRTINREDNFNLN